MLPSDQLCKASLGVLLMEQDKYENHDNDELKGMYADCFRIGQSAYKIVLDFGQRTPDGKEKYFHTRVIMGPDTAKGLVGTVEQSIKDYENKFGRIPNSNE